MNRFSHRGGPSWYPIVPSVVVVGLSVLGLAGCAQQANSATTNVPANAQKVKVTAKNFSFAMDKTSFQSGKPIDFVVKSAEAVHGFSIVGTNIRQTLSAGEAAVNVVWTPPAPGQYIIRCDVFCGSGHTNMFTSFQVK